MPEGGSNAGLGIEAGLGFGGGSRFGVGLGLGLGPRRFQAPNPQQGSGLTEGLIEGTRDGAGQDPSLAATATHVVLPRSRRPPEFSRELQPGLRNDMVSFQVPCRVSLHRFWTPGA